MPKKVLFPTDYSEASNAALRHAVSIARQSEALLLVVHVEPNGLSLGATSTSDSIAQQEADLVTLLSSVTSGEEKPISHEFRVLRGDAASEIVRVAEEEQVELIIMATSGRASLRHFFLGSVADAVTRKANCPVLNIKQPSRGGGSGDSPGETRAEAQATAELGGVVFSEEIGEAHSGRFDSMELLTRAVDARATDVHIDPLGDDFEVRLRIDGRLEHFRRLSHDVGHALVTQLKVLAELDIADPFRPGEGRITPGEPIDNYEVRLTKLPVLGGDAIALRLLNRDRLLRPLDSLGLTSESLTRLQDMLRLGEGVVLVTGPAGSGKTTTAYSMAYAMDDGHRNVVTVEDPPEYRIPTFRQMSVDSRHEITMSKGLRTLLRMDPDVVIVGEIRDAETAEIAMRAASSGKYVFTTLHTRDVAATVTALRDLHIDNRSLAGNLTGIISQRLVRRLCPNCRRMQPIEPGERDLFQQEGVEAPEELPKAVGCPQCRNVGYRERTGIFEVVLPNRLIREAVEQGASEDDLRDLLRKHGTRSLLADAYAKVREGIISLEEARSMSWVHFKE